MDKFFPQLNKKDMLDIMYAAVPQQLWPPRPTRQDADTIRDVVRRASYNGRYGQQVRAAIGARVRGKKA